MTNEEAINMRGKKFVTAVILCSVLFSMTGCGMTGIVSWTDSMSDVDP